MVRKINPQKKELMEARWKVGERLERYRRLNNMNQTQVGNYLGISRQAYSKIERGDTPLKYEYASRLAGLYKIPVRILLNDDSSLDLKMADEIDVYKTESESLSCYETTFENRYWFKKEMIKTSAGEVERTYRIDDGIRGIDPKKLYTVEVNEHNNVLNLPIGSKIIIEHLEGGEKLTIDKPTYLVLQWDSLFIGKDKNYIDGIIPTEMIMEFIALVTPLKNLNEHLRTDGRYKTLYKYQYPHGNEYYMELESLQKFVKGIVRKVVIDF